MNKFLPQEVYYRKNNEEMFDNVCKKYYNSQYDMVVHPVHYNENDPEESVLIIFHVPNREDTYVLSTHLVNNHEIVESDSDKLSFYSSRNEAYEYSERFSNTIGSSVKKEDKTNRSSY